MTLDSLPAFELAATVAAAMAVGLLSLFPGVRLVGFGLLLLAAFLFGLSPDRRGRWLRTHLDWPILLLLVQMGLSFWASAQPDKSWVAACQLGAGVVAYYTLVNWSRDRARLWWAVAASIALGVGLALVAPFAVDWFRNRKTFLPASWYDFFPLVLSDSIHPNVMAGALVTLMPLPLALVLADAWSVSKRVWLRWVLLAACLVQLAVLVLTKSRGGYVAASLGLWLTLWLSGRRRWAVGFVLAGAVLAVWLLAQPATETSAELTSQDTVEAAQAALDPATWAFRQQVWQTAIRLVGDFPFTGVGLGTFNDVAALLYGLYAPQNPQAHNLFLQVGVDLGIPGLVSFLAIFVLAWWAAWRAYRLLAGDRALRAVAVGGLAGLVATAAHGLIDVHTWGSKGAFIPWALIALVVALHTLALNHSHSQNGQRGAVEP